jgi:flagellar basal-body rod modification protein FlgD
MNNLGNTSTFLNLLVAQLQHQDPTSPVDGTTFVTQLAEFNNVEQSLAVRTDMDAVSEKYLGTSTPPSAASSNSTTNTTNTQSL